MSRPWLTAFLMSANPPSSPAINRFPDAGLVFRSQIRHICTACLDWPSTPIVDRPQRDMLRHTSRAQVHLCPLMMEAWPPIIASTSPSGQTVEQAATPDAVRNIDMRIACHAVRPKTTFPFPRLRAPLLPFSSCSLRISARRTA